VLELLAPGDYAAIPQQTEVLGEAFTPDESLSTLGPRTARRPTSAHRANVDSATQAHSATPDIEALWLERACIGIQQPGAQQKSLCKARSST